MHPHMKMALELAQQGAHTSPNPLVGCVIVQGKKVVGQGYHHAYGKPHAETEALKQAGANAKGSTVYVTLEPCSHWGKTPPCVEALIRSKIKQVVVSMKDPNPRVSGRGFRLLRRAGIAVTVGEGSEEARQLNRPFIKRMTTGLPYVILKTAMSLDGKIATPQGDSRWISCASSRRWVHDLRAKVDAVMVGTRTALQDDPRLTSHGQGPNPLRVILDRTLKLPLNARVFNARSGRSLIVTTESAAHPKWRALERRGVRLWRQPTRSRRDLHFLLRRLSQENIGMILLEGGGTLNASFLTAGLVDEVCAVTAPMILGGENAKTPVEGPGVPRIRQAMKIKEFSSQPLGQDVLLRGYLN